MSSEASSNKNSVLERTQKQIDELKKAIKFSCHIYLKKYQTMSVDTFTCNSCLIQFKSSDLQRYHMKTEWHRYNLKRRVANLPPINAAQFAEKLQISERERAANQVDEFGFPLLKNLSRTPKDKKHARQSKKVTYAGSRERKIDETEIGADSLDLVRSISPSGSVASRISKLSVHSGDTATDFGEDTVSEYGFTSESNYEFDSGDDVSSYSSGEEFEEENISRTDCIFCGAKNKDVERNINHMFKVHGLYIPERSYLVDLTGLLDYLIDKVYRKKSCLCCGFQGSSLESIRAHMNSKRHCRLPYETKEERDFVAQFYDFSSLDAKSKEGTDETGPKRIHFADASEDEDENKNDPEVNQVSLYNDINSNYSVVPVDSTGMELTLPNGVRVGHRSGQRYYRQNLSLPPDYNESTRTISAADRRLASGVTERQFKQGLKSMQQLEKRAVNQQIRREKSSKINYQAHYRDELLQ